jgi:hypothetical protein
MILNFVHWFSIYWHGLKIVWCYILIALQSSFPSVFALFWAWSLAHPQHHLCAQMLYAGIAWVPRDGWRWHQKVGFSEPKTTEWWPFFFAYLAVYYEENSLKWWFFLKQYPNFICRANFHSWWPGRHDTNIEWPERMMVEDQSINASLWHILRM